MKILITTLAVLALAVSAIALTHRRQAIPDTSWLKIPDGSGGFRNATPQEASAYQRNYPSGALTMPALPSGKPATYYITGGGGRYATDADGNQYQRPGTRWIPDYR